MDDKSSHQPNEASDLAASPAFTSSSNPLYPSSLLHPSEDAVNDSEAGEEPVRAKLKETSIASIPRQIDPPSKVGTEDKGVGPDDAGELQVKLPSTDQSLDTIIEGRGRLLKKRSVEDSGADHEAQIGFIGTAEQISQGRQRKRSKDVHSGRVPQSDSHGVAASDSPVPEELEGGSEKDYTYPPGTIVDTQSKPDDRDEPAMQGSADHEMSDHLFSPRKKRSRDPLDADPHREQKIAATEEARAHRRSEEYERDDNPRDLKNKEQVNGTLNEESAPENVERLSIKEENQTSGLKEVSTASPFSAFSDHRPLTGASAKHVDRPSDTTASTFSSKFAASGFAALSKSSLSPFGLGAPASSSIVQSFGSTQEKAFEDKTRQNTGDGFGGLTSSSTSSPAVMAPSPFGSVTAASSGPTLTGTNFGRNFGSGNMSGAKLTSFAAPGADTTWGSTGSVKPFGAPAAKNSDDERSDSDGDGEGPADDGTDAGEPASRFQHHDIDTGEEGEVSIFAANRAMLFAFEEGIWKERGRGVFKLNVATVRSDEPDNNQKKGRFIMRAHQTYRILLNTPVFKQMQVGDSKGKEPPGKQVSLAVIEGGKPTPYLVRLSDSNEAKTLYLETRKLQEDL